MSFPRTALAAMTALALVTAAAPHALAQNPERTRVTPAGAFLGAAEREAAFAAIVDRIGRTYVFPGKTPAIIEALKAAKARGRYDVDSPTLFAARVTEDLERSSGDGHLYLNYDPDRYAAARKAEAAPPGAQDTDAFWRAEAQRYHHGLVEQRILPGNIRYLRVSDFFWTDDETGSYWDAAMRFLKGGDAAIIDIRGNGGGSDAAVRYAISHFMDPGQLLMTFHYAGQAPIQSRTVDNLPSGRLKGKPLYVLTDRRSASAAEEFAYHVRQFKLGELVGEKTPGGANNNELSPVAPGFMLSVSTGSPVHPVGQGNWEGVGIEPTIPAEPRKALAVAQAAALQRLLASPDATPLQRAEYEWARVGVEAQLRPPVVTARQLQGFAGKYGEAAVELRGSELWVKMSAGSPFRRLIPLTSDGLFAVEGNESFRIKFAPGRLEALGRGEAEPLILQRG